MIDIYSREFKAAKTILASVGIHDLTNDQIDEILEDLNGGIDYQQVAVDFADSMDLIAPNESIVRY
jgi:hypothetical protein